MQCRGGRCPHTSKGSFSSSSASSPSPAAAPRPVGTSLGSTWNPQYLLKSARAWKVHIVTAFARAAKTFWLLPCSCRLLPAWNEHLPQVHA